MHVVENDDQRVLGRVKCEKGDHCIDDDTLQRERVDLHDRRQFRRPPAQGGYDERQLGPMATGEVGELVGRHRRDQWVERVGPRSVRGGDVLVASACRDVGAGAGHSVAQLGDEAGLADPRFARHQQAPPRACLPLVEAVCGELLAADERPCDRGGQGGRQRSRSDAGWARVPEDPSRRDGLGQPLQLERPHRFELMVGSTAGQQAHDIRGVDLVRPCAGTQARGFHHRQAAPVGVELGDIPDGHPDSQAGRLRNTLRTMRLARLLHANRALQRGRGRCEHCHHSVAQRLDDQPVDLQHRVGDGGHQLFEPRVGHRVTDSGADLGGAHDVAEHDGPCRCGGQSAHDREDRTATVLPRRRASAVTTHRTRVGASATSPDPPTTIDVRCSREENDNCSSPG